MQELLEAVYQLLIFSWLQQCGAMYHTCLWFIAIIVNWLQHHWGGGLPPIYHRAHPRFALPNQYCTCQVLNNVLIISTHCMTVTIVAQCITQTVDNMSICGFYLCLYTKTHCCLGTITGTITVISLASFVLYSILV